MKQTIGVLLILVGCFMTLASIPPPTGFGTVPCKKWPTFYLQNYNPVSRSTYLQSFGLGDIQPKADVTVVGLYFADSDASQEAIQFQDRIAYSLHDYNVHNVAINFYAPRICALKECEATWSFNKFLYYTNSCENYIGGCEPGNTHLEIDNWQAQLSNVTNMPILQDTYWVDAWERFGGGEGDLFIYDSEGRLFAVWCTETNAEFMTRCTHVYKGGEMLSEASYKDVKTTVQDAADSDSEKRCLSFDDNYYEGYATNYYYQDAEADSEDDDRDDDDNDDVIVSKEDDDKTEATSKTGAKSGEDDDDDDDDSVIVSHEDDDDDDKAAPVANPNPNPHVDEDDSYYYGDDDDDDDDNPNARFNFGFHNNHKRRPRRTSWLSSIAAISIFAVTGVVLYHRWKKQRDAVMSSSTHSGTTSYSRLPVAEDQRSVELGGGPQSPGGKPGNRYGSV